MNKLKYKLSHYKESIKHFKYVVKQHPDLPPNKMIDEYGYMMGPGAVKSAILLKLTGNPTFKEYRDGYNKISNSEVIDDIDFDKV